MKRATLTLVAMVALVGLTLPAPPAWAVTWVVDQVPEAAGTFNNSLFGVAVVPGTNHAWAVGVGWEGGAADNGTAVASYWDGGGWTTQGFGYNSGELRAISAVTETNVWAVGQDGDGWKNVVHFDGTTWRWSQLPMSPLDVLAISAKNVWVVGQVYEPIPDAWRPAIAHYNGTSWSVKTPLVASTLGWLSGLCRVPGTNRLFAVGTVEPSDWSSARPLALKFDGSRWSRMTLPSQRVPGSAYAVAASSDANAMLVGRSDAGPIAERWNGSTWSRVPTPWSSGASLIDIAQSPGSNHFWAVGSDGYSAVIGYWNGTLWKNPDVDVPSAGPYETAQAVAVSKSANVWAVGEEASMSLPLAWRRVP